MLSKQWLIFNVKQSFFVDREYTLLRCWTIHFSMGADNLKTNQSFRCFVFFTTPFISETMYFSRRHLFLKFRIILGRHLFLKLCTFLTIPLISENVYFLKTSFISETLYYFKLILISKTVYDFMKLCSISWRHFLIKLFDFTTKPVSENICYFTKL